MLEFLVIGGFGLMVVSTIFSIGYFLGMSEALDMMEYTNKVNYSITEDLECSPCKYTDDGYCLRNENDYCRDDECNCPHIISEIRTLDAQCGCETTAQFCFFCKEILTEPKTEC